METKQDPEIVFESHEIFCIMKKIETKLKIYREKRTAIIVFLFLSLFFLNMQGKGDGSKTGSFEEKNLQPK